MERRMKEANSTQREFDFSIVSPKLTIEAMRDSGYKSTDHALAELIDNSVEANASVIEIVTVETPPDESARYSRARISEIAVSDNGDGMDAHVLRRALKFGDGTRLDRTKRGIGRFGIGLPQSSVSQCKRVDVWSWQNGADNALRCHMDIEEIKTQGIDQVPEPTHDPVPDRWRYELKETIGESSGTLVVWSELDRVSWRGAKKTLDWTASLCGRIYRKFLSDKQNPLVINLMAARNLNGVIRVEHSEICEPNDPLYLMNVSSTPKPFDNFPMFELFNEREWDIPISESEKGKVEVRCSFAKVDAINEHESKVKWPASYPNPGAAPWGKHAERNKGVSIVRARRELEVSLAWVNNYDPRERWWSVEVEFDPILDDIFGVVNNKQHAHLFVSGAGINEVDLKEDNDTLEEFRERLRESEDPRFWLVEIWNWIDEQIAQMRNERDKRRKGTRGPRHGIHPGTGVTVEDASTVEINRQKEQGETGNSDKDSKITPEEQVDLIIGSAKKKRVDEDTAEIWAREAIENGRRVILKPVTLGHKDAFFDVESVGNVIEVWLNDQHPVYNHLIDVLSSDTDELTELDLKKKLETANFTLSLLFIAWARQEDKAPIGTKDTFADFRMDWGREARNFLKVFES